MEKTGQRHSERIKVAIHAVVSDRQQQNAIRCMIQDGSMAGCKIVSKQVSDLPDKVLLKVPQLSPLINGRIVWRKQDSAGIEFQWETTYPNDKRNAPRQEVSILATIMDYGFNKLADCIICDASSTGCRISCKELSTLPDELHIEIPGLTEPVLALVVWRKNTMAGLEFFWETEVYMLDDTLLK